MSNRYDEQNFSRHERDRERELHRHGEDDYIEHSQRFGQREPYSASGSGYQPDRQQHDDYARHSRRGEWSDRPGESRYSESQYGQRRYIQDRYEPQPEGRWSRSGYGGGQPGYQSGYRGARGYAPPADEWRRGRSFGVGHTGSADHGYQENRDGYGQPGRYDTQAPGGVGYSGEPRFGEEVFGAPSQPSYFGTGSYSGGGVGFGGGY
ncbi:MAG: hypothetical protein ABI885_16380, partial [Gammaproteobacteria bacterium]